MTLGDIDIRTTLAIVLGALGIIGAIVTGIIRALPSRRQNDIEQAKLNAQSERTATEEWRTLFNETRVELTTARTERERIEQSYYGLLGLFVQFRNHVSNEVSDIGVLLDRKELETAQDRLARLGRHISKLRFPHEDKA